MVELIRGSASRRYFLANEGRSVISVARDSEDGRLDTKLSEFWSELIDQNLDSFYTSTCGTDNSEMDTEFQSEHYLGRCTLMLATQMLPVVGITWAYLTGNILREYQSGKRTIGGVDLPDGMLPQERLPEPIFTPAVFSGDRYKLLSIKEMSELIDNGKYVGRAHPVTVSIDIKRNSLDVFRYCSNYAKRFGIIIAGARFHYGVTYNYHAATDGRFPLYLEDELITPESSKLWASCQYAVGCHIPLLQTRQVCSMLGL